MACFRPIEAWKTDEGKIKFDRDDSARELTLPCGKCIGCKQVRARDWAIRLQHEAQQHKEKQFITLTYNEQNETHTLSKKETKKFIDKLRQKIKREQKTEKYTKIKYYATGEYGETGGRPHYHIIIYGYAFKDLKKFDDTTYTSAELEKLWGKGYCTIGEVNEKTTNYVTKYVTKNHSESSTSSQKSEERMNWQTGEILECQKEFATMSLKPAIGKTWFLKNWKEVYEARDAVVQKGGNHVPPPKYYDKLLKEYQPILEEEKKYERYKRSERYIQDATPQRLAAREQCAKAKSKRTKTKL